MQQSCLRACGGVWLDYVGDARQSLLSWTALDENIVFTPVLLYLERLPIYKNGENCTALLTGLAWARETSKQISPR